MLDRCLFCFLGMTNKQSIDCLFTKFDSLNGSLSNLTDACQGVLYDFDKGAKQNLSVWCFF
ncbi:hypothetical protein DSB65_06975 [Lactobacillus delbrueckii]|nr:hypothetical protein [Lactobacillus delbrueckii]